MNKFSARRVHIIVVLFACVISFVGLRSAEGGGQDSNLRRQITDLSKSVTDLKKQVDDLSKKIDEQKTKIESQNTFSGKLRTYLIENDKSIRDLIEAQKKRLDSHDQSFGEVKSVQNQHKGSLDNQAKTFGETRATLNQLKSGFENHERRLRTMGR